MVEQAPPATSHRSRTRLVVQGLLSLVLVVAIFYYLRKKFDPAQAWAAITAMTGLELSILGLLAVWNLCTYAFVWMTVTPGLGVPAGHGHDPGNDRGGQHRARRVGHRHRHDLFDAGVLGGTRGPGRPPRCWSRGCGTASSSSACRSWPWPWSPSRAARTGGGSSPPCWASPGWSPPSWSSRCCCAARSGAHRFGLLAGRIATRLRRILGRGPVTGWELATVKFRARTVDLVEHRWISITVTSLVSHLSLYAVLLVALRDVGVSEAEVGWRGAGGVRVCSAGHRHPADPGGAGFVEGVLFTGLVGAGGDPDQVAAAVLVYRALTWALPILVGIGCYGWWRRAPGRPTWHSIRPRRHRIQPRRGDHDRPTHNPQAQE